ncbi:unnamed protein product [Rhizoctonia solani]|uniref:Store-operated calcium entry-associated regulatory factor n=1 Tax=Rhizoctonia solani TaxID=456999 RepID=A0A8H3E4B0_9AGAM|nr:unnamed protein product [Rhizoctonia solani]
MERVPLSAITTLVLYADEHTRSRRTAPVPQLECTGSVCREFQPGSVYCTKAGHSDWKCEADLPASLRFGKLHVSCEGWDRPGDPILWFKLFPRARAFWELSEPEHRLYLSGRSWGSGTPGGGGPFNRGGRGGGPNSSNDAPPPYSKHAPNSSESWRPGFWTGLGAGGLAAGMFNYLTRPRPTNTAWDWDRASAFTGTGTGPYRPEPSAFRRRYDYDDSGAGSSTGPGTRLGEMRRATGYANTSVR